MDGSKDSVFPTHVGVFLGIRKPFPNGKRLPHARGGVSIPEEAFAGYVPSSPRTWGCFSEEIVVDMFAGVFPTHVGVFPEKTGGSGSCASLPHARGGVSGTDDSIDTVLPSSPRTWGCFHNPWASEADTRVFPTHVGVFPEASTDDQDVLGLPHARGGVSQICSWPYLKRKSSPRTWGCFYRWVKGDRGEEVFPTHVGVFPAMAQIATVL